MTFRVWLPEQLIPDTRGRIHRTVDLEPVRELTALWLAAGEAHQIGQYTTELQHIVYGCHVEIIAPDKR